MARMITTLHLSDIQKEVLAKIKAAPNPQMAFELITRTSNEIDDNFAAARDVLGDLGLVDVGEGTLEVTEQGIEEMQEENLVDESGELTEEGQSLADQDRSEHPKPEEQPAPPPSDDMGMGGDDMGMGGDEMGELPMESTSLFRQIHIQASEKIELDRFLTERKKT